MNCFHCNESILEEEYLFDFFDICFYCQNFICDDCCHSESEKCNSCNETCCAECFANFPCSICTLNVCENCLKHCKWCNKNICENCCFDIKRQDQDICELCSSHLDKKKNICYFLFHFVICYLFQFVYFIKNKLN